MQEQQGSDEWLDDRAGKLTASRFADVIAKTGTARRRNYLEAVAEELRGVPAFAEAEKPWFQHGKEYEGIARRTYAWERDVEVTQVSLITHRRYPFIAASPDGLIGDDGGLEIKCHKQIKEYWASQKWMPGRHKAQVQGNLWVTGREYWDFMAYYIGPPSQHKIHRILRDEEYIQELEIKCLTFWEEVKERVKEMKENECAS